MIFASKFCLDFQFAAKTDTGTHFVTSFAWFELFPLQYAYFRIKPPADKFLYTVGVFAPDSRCEIL